MKNQWKKIFFPQDPKKILGHWLPLPQVDLLLQHFNLGTSSCSWLFMAVHSSCAPETKPKQMELLNIWLCHMSQNYIFKKKHMVFVSFLKTYRFGFPENQPSLAAPDQMFCREGGLIGCANMGLNFRA